MWCSLLQSLYTDSFWQALQAARSQSLQAFLGQVKAAVRNSIHCWWDKQQNSQSWDGAQQDVCKQMQAFIVGWWKACGKEESMLPARGGSWSSSPAVNWKQNCVFNAPWHKAQGKADDGAQNWHPALGIRVCFCGFASAPALQAALPSEGRVLLWKKGWVWESAGM